MTYICGKWLKYLGYWLKYLTNGVINWEMTQRFGNRLKCLGNSLDIWGTA